MINIEVLKLQRQARELLAVGANTPPLVLEKLIRRGLVVVHKPLEMPSGVEVSRDRWEFGLTPKGKRLLTAYLESRSTADCIYKSIQDKGRNLLTLSCGYAVGKEAGEHNTFDTDCLVEVWDKRKEVWEGVCGFDTPLLPNGDVDNDECYKLFEQLVNYFSEVDLCPRKAKKSASPTPSQPAKS